MLCEKCGAESGGNALFCGRCGAALTAVSAQSGSVKGHTKWLAMLIIGAVTVTVLLAGGLYYALFWHGGGIGMLVGKTVFFPNGYVQLHFKGVTPMSSGQTAAAVGVLKNRLSALGYGSKSTVETAGADEILIKLEWDDQTNGSVEKFANEIGSAGVLTLRDPDGNIIIGTQHIKKAQAVENASYNPAAVSVELTEEGGRLFGDATERLAGQAIGIYMDETLLSAPRVTSRIDGGEFVITGDFDMQTAKELADKLNYGPLPCALQLADWES